GRPRTGTGAHCGQRRQVTLSRPALTRAVADLKGVGHAGKAPQLQLEFQGCKGVISSRHPIENEMHADVVKLVDTLS
ncbi:MAG: hypothetical protein ACRC2B_07905, partial [Rubrivivax sp.]